VHQEAQLLRTLQRKHLIINPNSLTIMGRRAKYFTDEEQKRAEQQQKVQRMKTTE
jgi:hypothetical protein